jgi:hypothetical protein
MTHSMYAATRRLLALSLTAIASGCTARAEQPATADRASTIRIDGTNAASTGAASLDWHHEAGRHTATIPVSADRAWPALSAAYEQIGLTVSSIDPGARRLGVDGERLRRIDGRSVSAFFNCGGDFGNDAARFNVFVTAHTRVAANPDGGSTLTTEVDAVAAASASGTRVRCVSTGLLERTIAERVRTIAAR